MIIINKKRLLFIEFALVFSIFFASLSLNKLENTNTISTSSTPVTGHTITLDAGHGIPDEGAQNKDGLTESGINLKIVLKLQKLLEASNCNVILTRSDENGIYDLDSKSLREMKVSDMKNRVKIGNSSDSDLFISILPNNIASIKTAVGAGAVFDRKIDIPLHSTYSLGGRNKYANRYIIKNNKGVNDEKNKIKKHL